MEMLLRCQVSDGQLADEYAIEGKRHDGTGFSLFVPLESVEISSPITELESVPGWLHVVVEKRKDDLCLIRLPRQTLDNGQFITVRTSQLERPRTPHEA